MTLFSSTMSSFHPDPIFQQNGGIGLCVQHRRQKDETVRMHKTAQTVTKHRNSVNRGTIDNNEGTLLLDVDGTMDATGMPKIHGSGSVNLSQTGGPNRWTSDEATMQLTSFMTPTAQGY